MISYDDVDDDAAVAIDRALPLPLPLPLALVVNAFRAATHPRSHARIALARIARRSIAIVLDPSPVASSSPARASSASRDGVARRSPTGVVASTKRSRWTGRRFHERAYSRSRRCDRHASFVSHKTADQ
jgi:hypothetical protein